MNAQKVVGKIQNLDPVRQTGLLIDYLHDDPEFARRAAEAGQELARRDAMDDDALAQGIEYARRKGLLDSPADESEWQPVVCDGRSPDDIAAEIASLSGAGRETPRSITICGPSGVGKGATVRALTALSEWYWVWSNGGVFRFITYLVYRENSRAFALAEPELESLVRRRAESLQLQPPSTVVAPDPTAGADRDNAVLRLSDIPAGELGSVAISQKVPVVAQWTQGDVVQLANAAYDAQSPGACMIIEGRKPTLQYNTADLRVELEIRDPSVLGERRVAQRFRDHLLANPPADGESLSDSFVRLYR